jgi:tRNA-Thr(GGU) m(6)t(6)A37 methyltransferase TsaA
MKAVLEPIGYINTPYKDLKDCPKNIDPNGPVCHLILNSEYIEGLSGLQPGQRILILYWLENTNRSIMHQKRRGVGKMSGTFSLRSPHRPNPIGAATLPIEKIEKGIVTVKGLDCLDGTSLIDIKPAILQE